MAESRGQTDSRERSVAGGARGCRRATGTASQLSARRALISSAIQMGMIAYAAASSSTSAPESPGRSASRPSSTSSRAEPCQCADDLARLAARRRQLPARGVTQLNRDAPELQPPAATRGEIDLADGILGGQAQPVGRGAAAGDDGLAPELGERFERLAETGPPKPESGLDGTHVDALADPHQLSRSGPGATMPGPPPRACPSEGGQPDRSASPRADATTCSMMRFGRLGMVLSRNFVRNIGMKVSFRNAGLGWGRFEVGPVRGGVLRREHRLPRAVFATGPAGGRVEARPIMALSEPESAEAGPETELGLAAFNSFLCRSATTR